MSTADHRSNLSRRDLFFILFLAGSIAIFWKPLQNLFSFSLTHDYASHIILIAPVSAYLIYLRRNEIFSVVRTGLLPGSLLLFAGTTLWWFAATYPAASIRHNEFSLLTLAMVIIWISGFILCYGPRAFATALFPWLFLLLLVPIPEIVVEKLTFLLQTGSAAVAYGLLRVLSIPVLKQGFILRLPTLDIEVAKECSGIRSSLALLITTLLVADFILRSAWRKALLVLSILPVLILKNGVRIVSICLLSIYVNRGFLHGWLHTSGGIVFYLLGVAILAPLVTALRKSEGQILAPRNLNVSEPPV